MTNTLEHSPAAAAKNIWTAHPLIDFVEGGKYRALTDEDIGKLLAAGSTENEIEEYWRDRERKIDRSEKDPLRWGFELPFWQDVREFLARKDELYALGGNGPGKTEIGGKLVVEKLCESSGMKVLCVATNEPSSKQLQQAAVYKYLPISMRTVNERLGPKRREVIKKVTYSQAGGFTEGTFVLSNRSQCWFKTVEQYQREPTSFEGPEYDLVWLDEPVPLALLETLRYRLGKRRGKLLNTFTAIFGFDATCSMVLQGARVLKSLPMNFLWDLTAPAGERRGGPDPRVKIPELSLDEVQVMGCPAGHMPYMMQPLDLAQGAIFLWTAWNVFLPRSQENPVVPAMFDKCLRKSKQTVRMRLFGWAEKLSGCQFPAFNPNVHIVPHEKIMAMLKPPGEDRKPLLTAYMAGDPATARSYFFLWRGIDSLGRSFIYDESPRIEEGEWVSDDGDKGDGQRIYAGKGINFYKTHIRMREQEHGVCAVRRFGDPRAFATEAAAAEGGKSLLELFSDFDEHDPDNELIAPMRFEPAKVMRSLLAEAASGSLDKINDAFSYDNEKPISVENEPHLYVSDRCQNLIKSILNWDPTQGEKSPWKDPIDVFRYLFGETLYYVDPDIPEIVQGKGW